MRRRATVAQCRYAVSSRRVEKGYTYPTTPQPQYFVFDMKMVSHHVVGAVEAAATQQCGRAPLSGVGFRCRREGVLLCWLHRDNSKRPPALKKVVEQRHILPLHILVTVPASRPVRELL